MIFGSFLIVAAYLHLCSKDAIEEMGLEVLRRTRNRSLRIFIWQAIVRRPSVSTEGLFYLCVCHSTAVCPLPFSQSATWPRHFSKASALHSTFFPGPLFSFPPLAFFRLFFSIFAAHLRGLPPGTVPANEEPAR
jgi:hypothetical protein